MVFVSRTYALLVFFLIGHIVQAQLDVQFIDYNSKITSVNQLTSGHLICGTENGKIITFDGLRFTPLTTVGEKVMNINTKGPIEIVTTQHIYKLTEDQVSQDIAIQNILEVVLFKEKKIVLTQDKILHQDGIQYLPESTAPTISASAKKNLILHNEVPYLSLDSTIYQFTTKWRKWKTVPFVIHDMVSHNDALYAGGPPGLFVIDKHHTKQVMVDNRAITDTINRIFSTHNYLIFSSDEGITFFDNENYLKENWRISNSKLSSIYLDSWNNGWLVVNNSLVKVRLGQNTDIPPILNPVQVRLGFENLKNGPSGITLDKDENDIGFDFSAIHLDKPEDIIYQYKLYGHDQSWSEWTANQSANYSDLSPGKYEFKVRASVDKINYKTSIGNLIKIKSDPINSIWYFLIGVGLSVLLLTWISNRRMKSLKEKSKREINKLRTQNKLMTFQQKSLQLQMNPHFVFNALNSIQGLIDMDDNRNARNYLKEFSAMMRMVLQHSRAEYIPLEDEIKYLQYYLSLEQMTRNHTFDFVISVDSTIEDDIQVPPMIIQPFVENAIIHGVSKLEDRKGKITIKFLQKENQLLCEIRDNGIGRKAAGERNTAGHVSVATSVVEERLDNLFKHKSQNHIVFEDLTNDGNTGTVVTIKIPYT